MLEQSNDSKVMKELSLEEPVEQQIQMVQSNANQEENEAKQQEHLIELHIDVRSIKGLAFPAKVFISYNVPLVDSGSFQSKPTAAPKGAELMLQNTFAHYKFKANQDSLCNQLSAASLDIDVYDFHEGLNALIGTAQIPLAGLLGPDSSVQKTSQSVVRVFDIEVPILKNTDKEMGKLRCILYLEDRGPILKAAPAVPMTESQPKVLIQGTKPMQKKEEDSEIDQINLWKKAEETKFKAMLKQREQEALNQIAEEWKQKDTKRENEFRERIEAVRGTETKLRSKNKDLLKREQQIVKLEDELKGKIMEITKRLADKEEEIISVKTKCKEEKTSLEKEKKVLVIQIESIKKQLLESESKFRELKKEYEESPISQLKQEIHMKAIQLIEVEKKLEKSIQAKEQYRGNYEKIKGELIKLRNNLDLEKERNLEKQKEEIEKLRLQITSQKFAEEEQKELRNLKTQLENLQREYDFN